MERSHGDRIFGVETEFGTLVSDPNLGTPEQIVELVKDYLFEDVRLGVIDQIARDDVFEPARSGGFLINGARLYIDAVGSHLEYATAECRSLKDMIANDRAGQRQIVRALRELGISDGVSIYNNSIDHFGGHTFGCHENYQMRADEQFYDRCVPMFLTFLVTRQIFAGVGRVGGHRLFANAPQPTYDDVMQNPIDYIWVSHVYGVEPDETVDFQLSQRADHILKTVASRVRFNRAMINPKWEHYYSHDGYTRLHLLFGESNQNEFAYALKVGTTRLVLRLLEEDLVPDSWVLRHPLVALREVSRDPNFEWNVEMRHEESPVGAIELQRRFLELAEVYRGETEETDWVLDEWASILDGLAKDPMSLGDRIDWVAKRKMVEEYRQSEGLEWSDDALHSVDLEYHNIDPDQSLFHALQSMGETRRVVSELDVIDAMTEPPIDTRAFGRAKLVRKALEKKVPKGYYFDWSQVVLNRHDQYDLSDPFETYAHLGD